MTILGHLHAMINEILYWDYSFLLSCFFMSEISSSKRNMFMRSNVNANNLTCLHICTKIQEMSMVPEIHSSHFLVVFFLPGGTTIDSIAFSALPKREWLISPEL